MDVLSTTARKSKQKTEGNEAGNEWNNNQPAANKQTTQTTQGESPCSAEWKQKLLGQSSERERERERKREKEREKRNANEQSHYAQGPKLSYKIWKRCKKNKNKMSLPVHVDSTAQGVVDGEDQGGVPLPPVLDDCNIHGCFSCDLHCTPKMDKD